MDGGPARLLGALLLLQGLAAFAGKVPPPVEIRRATAVDKSARTLVFAAFQNGTPGKNDYLSESLPKAIALAVKGLPPLTLEASRVIPSWNGAQVYRVLEMTNAAGTWTPVDTNAGTKELLSDPTRFVHDLEDAGRRLVYLEASNVHVLDPLGRSNDFKPLPGEILLTGEWPGLPKRIALLETNGFRRNLEVVDSLFVGKADLDGLFQQSGADFAVTGTFRTDAEERLELQVIVAERSPRSTRLALTLRAQPEKWYEATRLIPPLLVAAVAHQPLVTNLAFISTPPGAGVYLGDRFAGVTPFTLPAWPAGPWTPEFRSLDGDWLLDPFSFPKVLGATDAGRSFSATLKPLTNRARLSVRTSDAEKIDLYRGALKLAGPVTNWSGSLPAGNWVITASPSSNSNLEPRRFALTLENRSAVSVDLRLFPRNRLVTRHREAQQAFGAAGLGFTFLGLFSYLQQAQYMDRRDTAFQLGYPTRSFYANAATQWSVATYAFGGAAAVSLLGVLLNRLLEVRLGETALETPDRLRPGLRIQVTDGNP